MPRKHTATIQAEQCFHSSSGIQSFCSMFNIGGFDKVKSMMLLVDKLFSLLTTEISFLDDSATVQSIATAPLTPVASSCVPSGFSH